MLRSFVYKLKQTIFYNDNDIVLHKYKNHELYKPGDVPDLFFLTNSLSAQAARER